jgi:GT2 family glycosyltransferase
VSRAVKVLFASGSEKVNAATIERMQRIFPELPLVVVAEFPPHAGEWIPFHIRRTWDENRDLVRWRLQGRTIRLGAVILEPRIPHWPLRRLGFALSGIQILIFNENGGHFMLRPRSVPAMLRHIAWRARNAVRGQFQFGGLAYKLYWLARNADERRLTILYRRAMARGRRLAASRNEAAVIPVDAGGRPRGISVVIPSRNGVELLKPCLERLRGASEIVVVDNGSADGTADFLRREHPGVILASSAEPLTFAQAANRGIGRARFSHVCLLNNDMLVEPGFLDALRRPFEGAPELFASTAQIFLPEGQRREETGKTVMPSAPGITGFPVRCDVPLEGEDGTWVLYGSGGCTLYDAAKLAALGGFDEAYQPAYVEDLDLGVRAWLRGWPSVYCAAARTLHRHRATTSRYFSPEEMDLALEANYARFLARAVPDRSVFLRMWSAHMLRLKVLGKAEALEASAALPVTPVASGDLGFLDLVRGDVAVFPGRARSGNPVVLIASPYLPFPLSHGAAVRIYNLMRRAARDFDLVLVAFVEQFQPVAPELREICTEIAIVRRPGTHALPSTPRPETVEEFDSPVFHATVRQMDSKWRPRIAQFEFTQMAVYAPDCPGARTILVEHDITYDLYAQMLAREEDWEARRQYERWVKFERAAWKQVDRVVTMSEKDRALVEGAVTVANGVDLDRFRPSTREPEPHRLLFIGSFAHKPNVLAVEFFLREVFPRIPGAALHVIAGQRHQRFWDLREERVEVEGFVSDVRPAYERATVVIAPLVASAGTNIKILEAMAMGKAIVSTEAGIHGLDLERGRDAIVTNSAQEMAAAIERLFESPESRACLERQARATAERLYGWDAIAERQKELYQSLL